MPTWRQQHSHAAVMEDNGTNQTTKEHKLKCQACWSMLLMLLSCQLWTDSRRVAFKLDTTIGTHPPMCFAPAQDMAGALPAVSEAASKWIRMGRVLAVGRTVPMLPYFNSADELFNGTVTLVI